MPGRGTIDRKERRRHSNPQSGSERDRNADQPAIAADVEKFVTLSSPARLTPSRRRDLDPVTMNGKGRAIHFRFPRFVGDVGYPLAVRRKNGFAFVELRSREERLLRRSRKRRIRSSDQDVVIRSIVRSDE